MLAENMTTTGRWLFRWRAYLPLIMLPLLFVGPQAYYAPQANHALDRLWEFSGLLLSMLGLAVRIVTAGFVPTGTSGRGTKAMQAKTLNTTGMYAIVRHPLYLGNILIFAGILLALGSWSHLLIGLLAFWLYYERIMLAEEALLAETFGDTFRQWAAQTPGILPRFRRWQPPSLTFSMRSAIRREYTTVFLTICLFTGFKVVGDSMAQQRFVVERPWQVIFWSSLAVYLFMRVIKKCTSVLDVPGR
jgi:protein-S-isoprenylcysteine O-methyltransferase Ste14